MPGQERADWTGALLQRTILVTGGSGGLGREVVRLLMAAGARIHVPIYADEEIPELQSYLGDAFQNLELHLNSDLTDPEQVDRLFDEIREREGGGPDSVVNLAGGFAMGPIEDTSPDTWERLWTMNASTAFLVSRRAFPVLRERGGGRIVNISAVPAFEGGAENLSAYGASKAAVLHLTRSLAKEGVAHGITVNAILPSIIDTPGNRSAMPDADRSRWVPPAAIARIIRFLVSDEGDVVNGAVIPATLGPA